MKNLKRSTKTIDECLAMVSKQLQNPKREFFHDNETLLKASFEDYDKKAATGRLIELQPVWSETDCKTYMVVAKGATKHVTKSHQELAYDLYGSSRPFVEQHWDELKLLNSLCGIQREEIICPICGLRQCSQMDHHAPRALNRFPEYSSHLSNLIPLCGNCNETKHDYWIEKENGVDKRIWFNPYFDILPDFDIFISHIEILSSIPKVIVELNKNIDRSIEVHDVICRTVSHLKLTKQYENELDILLASYSEKLILNYHIVKNRYKDIDDYILTQCTLVLQLLKDGKRQTLMDILLYRAILCGSVYMDWLKLELQKS